jgi:hypothetical protein
VAEAGKVVAEPRIVCNQKALYSWDDAVAPGASRRSSRAWERSAATTGEWEYWLQYSDLGTRTIPLQAKIDTPSGRIVLWREEQPTVRVELEVERWAKRRGEPLFGEPAAVPTDFEPLEREGRIAKATGQSPQPVGTRCSFKLMSIEGSHNCRSIVRCGETIIYGKERQGFLDCAFVDGLPLTAKDTSDTDGDPTFDMDLRAGRLVTGTHTPPPGYDMTIELEP